MSLHYSDIGYYNKTVNTVYMIQEISILNYCLIVHLLFIYFICNCDNMVKGWCCYIMMKCLHGTVQCYLMTMRVYIALLTCYCVRMSYTALLWHQCMTMIKLYIALLWGYCITITVIYSIIVALLHYNVSIELYCSVVNVITVLLYKRTV